MPLEVMARANHVAPITARCPRTSDAVMNAKSGWCVASIGALLWSVGGSVVRNVRSRRLGNAFKHSAYRPLKAAPISWPRHAPNVGRSRRSGERAGADAGFGPR